MSGQGQGGRGDALLMVSSATLTEAAVLARKHDAGMAQTVNGVTVSAQQLDAAARILREADPSVANGNVQERPGWINRDSQDWAVPEMLVFELGILPKLRFRIDRAGTIVEAPADWPAWEVRYHVPLNQCYAGSRGTTASGRAHLHAKVYVDLGRIKRFPGNSLCGKGGLYERRADPDEPRCPVCVERAERYGVAWPAPEPAR